MREKLQQAHLVTAQALSQTIEDFEAMLRNELHPTEATRQRLMGSLKLEATRWLTEAEGMSSQFKLHTED